MFAMRTVLGQPWIGGAGLLPSDSTEGCTPKSVDAFHSAALATGGLDIGAPGRRADYGPGYHGAFVIDPDGYRLEAHCDQSAS
jgi:hypothetical protein